jgi:hypothetical protein
MCCVCLGTEHVLALLFLGVFLLQAVSLVEILNRKVNLTTIRKGHIQVFRVQKAALDIIALKTAFQNLAEIHILRSQIPGRSAVTFS